MRSPITIANACRLTAPDPLVAHTDHARAAMYVQKNRKKGDAKRYSATKSHGKSKYASPEKTASGSNHRMDPILAMCPEPFLGKCHQRNPPTAPTSVAANSTRTEPRTKAAGLSSGVRGAEGAPARLRLCEAGTAVDEREVASAAGPLLPGGGLVHLEGD